MSGSICEENRILKMIVPASPIYAVFFYPDDADGDIKIVDAIVYVKVTYRDRDVNTIIDDDEDSDRNRKIGCIILDGETSVDLVEDNECFIGYAKSKEEADLMLNRRIHYFETHKD